MPDLKNLILIIFIGIIVIGAIVFLISRYRRCPSDKVLVIYGKIASSKSGDRSSKCINGGAAFIWPVIQSFQFMDLTPISMNIDLRNALSKQSIRVDVPSRFTVGISTEMGIMQNAAERLLGLKSQEVEELAKDIISGQLRLVIAQMRIEEINIDREKFLELVSSNVKNELAKVGLRLININIKDIKDESGYIEALGKEAAAKAINNAKKSVAIKNKDGAICEAQALKDQKIKVSEANAIALEGENKSKVIAAQSDSKKRQLEAEALREATASEKVQSALALKEAYQSEKEAEEARAAKEMATKEADIIVEANIEKRRIEIQAEAQAEQFRREAKGHADAIFAKKEAEARGNFEILSKQAQGFEAIVSAAGGSADDAVRLLIADKMEELVKIQVEAIKNLKIDKVTVWDSMNGRDGQSTTADFLSSIMKSVPPMSEMFDMAGMKLPDYLGNEKQSDKKSKSSED